MQKIGCIGAVCLGIAWIVIIFALMFDFIDFPSGGEEEYCQPGKPGICY